MRTALPARVCSRAPSGPAPVAMRSTKGCCSALWKVTNGRASAPPAAASSTGVSTCLRAAGGPEVKFRVSTGRSRSLTAFLLHAIQHWRLLQRRPPERPVKQDWGQDRSQQFFDRRLLHAVWHPRFHQGARSPGGPTVLQSMHARAPHTRCLWLRSGRRSRRDHALAWSVRMCAAKSRRPLFGTFARQHCGEHRGGLTSRKPRASSRRRTAAVIRARERSASRTPSVTSMSTYLWLQGRASRAATGTRSLAQLSEHRWHMKLPQRRLLGSDKAWQHFLRQAGGQRKPTHWHVSERGLLQWV
jgi:hypothetical protein